MRDFHLDHKIGRRRLLEGLRRRVALVQSREPAFGARAYIETCAGLQSGVLRFFRALPARVALGFGRLAEQARSHFDRLVGSVGKVGVGARRIHPRDDSLGGIDHDPTAYSIPVDPLGESRNNFWRQRYPPEFRTHRADAVAPQRRFAHGDSFLASPLDDLMRQCPKRQPFGRFTSVSATNQTKVPREEAMPSDGVSRTTARTVGTFQSLAAACRLQ